MKTLRLALLAFALSASGTARAKSAIELDGCDPLDRELLVELFELELRTLKLDQSHFELVVSCEGESATIRVLQAVTGATPARTSVDLSRTAPEARERLVALAASELLAQAERERREEAPAPQAEPAPPPRPPLFVALPRPKPLPALLVGASATRMGDPRTVLWGALLGMQAPLPGPLSLGVDTRYAWGTTETPLASVDWTLLSAAIELAVEGLADPFTITLGPSLRGGWVALEAQAESPARGDRVTGPWLAGAGVLRFAPQLERHVLLFAGLEVGCVLVPVRGTVDDGPTLVSADGCFVGGSACAGYRF